VPWLTRFISELEYDRYFEPFLGGGALFFALSPAKALLSDLNPDLINTYKEVKRNSDLIIERLKELRVNARTYIDLRRLVPSDNTERAIRFLYLNRTAFSGMYRLNRNGEFNVPFGGGERTPGPLWRDGLLSTARAALTSARLRACDFETALKDAGSGDLVYCDPTYTVSHNNNGFVRYNERNFAWEDQRRLASCCNMLARRGAAVIVSNADHGDIYDLFRPDHSFVIDRASTLCPNPTMRRLTQEAILIFSGKRRRSKKPTT
jgi:DNA adenine methylase